MKNIKHLTKADVGMILEYDLEGQIFVWRQRCASMFANATSAKRWNTRWAGNAAGLSVSGRGYRQITLLGQTILLHRLVFFLDQGRWPDGQVDHKDGDKMNNHPSNLRECTASQNQANKCAHGSSEYLGVTRRKLPKGDKWEVMCKNGDEHQYIGRFDTELEAAAAYDMAAQQAHGEFARLNLEQSHG